MSSSNEPEKKRIRSVDGSQVEADMEAVKELPKGWEKRMSRSNSLFDHFLKIIFLINSLMVF